VALETLNRSGDAIASYDRALAVRPDHVGALNNRGNALGTTKRYSEAIANYERLLSIEPDYPYALSQLARFEAAVCNWEKVAELAPELDRGVAEGKSIVDPLTFLSYSDDAGRQLACARRFVRDRVIADAPPLLHGTRNRYRKLRLAYVSSDFRYHPVANLIAELIEIHDRSRFEVIGVSTGADDRSEVRARLAKSFDQFHEMSLRTDYEIAQLMNELQVDIAIDLNGHTAASRLNVFAQRPAPIQVVYLGYASTTGAEFFDYVIADDIVLPFEQQPFYTEKIMHLPDCFLVNDTKKAISPRVPTRREAGLPDKGFVFC